jgi:hypothetical protein
MEKAQLEAEEKWSIEVVEADLVGRLTEEAANLHREVLKMEDEALNR